MKNWQSTKPTKPFTEVANELRIVKGIDYFVCEKLPDGCNFEISLLHCAKCDHLFPYEEDESGLIQYCPNGCMDLPTSLPDE